MAGFGIYAKKAQEATAQQAQTLSAMKPKQPKKGIGAGLMAGAAGAIAGQALAPPGPWGLVGGAGVGLASYYLS